MTYRIGVVGAGDWARRHHLPALADDPRATVAVIIDSDESRRSACARENAADSAATLEEALEQGPLDGLIIATPHSTHAALVTAAVNAGIATLVEKPLTLSSAEAFELVRHAERTRVPLVVGYTAQFSRAAAQVREWVSSEIGELRQIIVEFSSRAGARYAHAIGRDATSAYSAASGGGQATTQLTHAFAAICYSTGRQFTEVMALTSGRGIDVDVDDVVAFRLDGEVTGAAASTGTLPPGLPMRHAVRYLGSTGIVEHDLLMSTARLDGLDGVSTSIAPTHLDVPYPAGAPVATLLDLLDGADVNPAPVRPAAAAVAGIEAVLLSARTGRSEAVAAVPY